MGLFFLIFKKNFFYLFFLMGLNFTKFQPDGH